MTVAPEPLSVDVDSGDDGPPSPPIESVSARSSHESAGGFIVCGFEGVRTTWCGYMFCQVFQVGGGGGERRFNRFTEQV